MQYTKDSVQNCNNWGIYPEVACRKCDLKFTTIRFVNEDTVKILCKGCGDSYEMMTNNLCYYCMNRKLCHECSIKMRDKLEAAAIAAFAAVENGEIPQSKLEEAIAAWNKAYIARREK